MSRKSQIIEVRPSLYCKNRDTEKLKLSEFLCPHCNGNKVFREQSGHNEYKETDCPVCEGTGELQAEVIINWIPSDIKTEV